MKFVKAVFELLQETARGWSRDKAHLLAAAIAYYTILSLAPLLVISVGIAGLFFGEAAVEGQIVGQIETFVGHEIAVTIQRIIENAATVNASGIAATIVGILLLFVGASSVINQLKTALNIVWGIAPKPRRRAIIVIKERFLSLTMVLGIGFLLLTIVALSIALTAVRRYLSTLSPQFVASLPRLDIAVTLVVITISFAIMFRVLPDAEVAWKDVWLGAVVTAILFFLGEYLIGIYLAYSSIGSAFGAAGSLVVILTWIYYSALILMFGAEFTQAFANKYGSKIRPSSDAELISTPAPVRPVAATSSGNASVLETADRDPPSRQVLNQIAAALLGMALGLLLAFLSNWRRNK